MRIFIALFIVFCCFILSLYAFKVEAHSTIQKAEKKSINLSKKESSSLKIDLFSNQIDLSHHSNQNHLVTVVYFLKFIQGLAISLGKSKVDFARSTTFHYHFTLQYLYPKHSFW